MRLNVLPSVSAFALCALSTAAFAIPFTSKVATDGYVIEKGGTANGIPTANYGNDGGPDLYDAVNAVLGTSYSSNQDLDDRYVENDMTFVGQGDQSVVLIGLAAANSNTLGFYDDLGTGLNKTDVLGPESGFHFSGDGSAANPFRAETTNISGPFGWYLDSVQWDTGQTTSYYSESSLNTTSSGIDHMMTFSLDELNGQTFWLNDGTSSFEYTFENALLIGWEDIPLSADGFLGDEDYDDIMYIIDSRTTDVPEPATVFSLAAGLIMLPLIRRRRKEFS